MEVKVLVEKKPVVWKATICPKCEQPFMSRKALRNHMRLAKHRRNEDGKLYSSLPL